MTTEEYLIKMWTPTREQLVFADDTRYPRSPPEPPSSGHCAVVAYMLWRNHNAKMFSTTIDGQSHWYNRIYVQETFWDIDLTGDQFGLPAVQVAKRLYDGRRRYEEELEYSTITRAEIFAERSGMPLQPHWTEGPVTSHSHGCLAGLSETIRRKLNAFRQ